jgi:hypothetical protein
MLPKHIWWLKGADNVFVHIVWCYVSHKQHTLENYIATNISRDSLFRISFVDDRLAAAGFIFQSDYTTWREKGNAEGNSLLLSYKTILGSCC